MELTLLALATILVSQVDTSWVRRYCGPAGRTDAASSIGVGNDGNVYVTGASEGQGTSKDYATVAYDRTGRQLWVARFNGLASHNDEAWSLWVCGSDVVVTGRSENADLVGDYMTIRYDSAGNTRWAKSYDGPIGGDDLAWAMTGDGNGNVYVTGYSGGMGLDYATVKYNSAGVEQWSARYNGPANGHDEARAVAVDNGGCVYITGRSDDPSTLFDYATIKYNPTGETVWVRRFNGPASHEDEAYALAVDRDGNVVVTGGSVASATLWDYATVKYTPAGETLWARRYCGPAWDIATAVAVDGDGNVYVAGSCNGFTNYDFGTVKYSSTGIEQWVAVYNGPANGMDIVSSLKLDAAGNVYVTGQSLGLGGYADYLTVKYTPDGVQRWVMRYEGNSGEADQAFAMTTDSAANVYVTGLSVGTDPYGDYVTIKYVQSPSGDEEKPPVSTVAYPVTRATVVSGFLPLQPLRTSRHQTAVLLDIVGRQAAELRPGLNDVGQLAQGIYFLCSGEESPTVKIVVSR